MEDVFNPRPEPLPTPPPVKVRTAQAAADPSTLTDQNLITPAGPDLPEKAPGQNLAGLVSPDDTRYKDSQNLLVANVLTGGMLPWIQATADVASGRVKSDDFDKVRQEHERRLDELTEQHPDFVAAAENAMPFVTGMMAGFMKPGKTIAGSMGKGAAVAAPQGAAQGYSSGPTEEPSVSGERVGRAVGRGAVTAAIGSAGAAVPSLIGKATSMVAERTARKTQEAASKKLADDAATADAAARGKKTAATDKAATTRLNKQRDKEFQAAMDVENKTLATDFQRYTSMPKAPSKFWQDNRKVFAQDPVGTFYEAAEKGIGMEGLARSLNLPPRVIVDRIAGKKLNLDNEAAERLFKEGFEVDRVTREFQKRGLSVPDAAASKPAETAAKAATSATSEPKAPAAPKPKAEPKAPKPAGDAKPKAPAKPRKKKLPDYITPRPPAQPGKPPRGKG
jgi:hypothetical protein